MLPYYKAIGFKVAGETFLHRENGPSIPMRLDLMRYGELLSKDRSQLGYVNLLVKAQVIKSFDRLRAAFATT